MIAVSLPLIRRALVTAIASVTCVLLAGATYQGVATAFERRRFPHPGRLIDVGGHQLHLYCVGDGQPTVVLEAPAMGMSAAWGWVQNSLHPLTRVCGYDRAGLGWSEAGDRDYEPSHAVEELHTLLERAEESRPYVMVGHELGAALATGYAARHRADLAALVLIDPPTRASGPGRSELVRFADAWPWLARTGVLRGTRTLSRQASGLPEDSAGAMSAFLNRPDHLTRAARELSRWDETMRFAFEASLDPGLYVARLATTGPVHVVFLSDADEARRVSDAIAGVVEAVRRHR